MSSIFSLCYASFFDSELVSNYRVGALPALLRTYLASLGLLSRYILANFRRKRRVLKARDVQSMFFYDSYLILLVNPWSPPSQSG